MTDDVCHEVKVGGRIDFWDDESIEVRSLKDRGKVLKGKAAGDGIDANSSLFDARRSRLREKMTQVLAGFVFAIWSDRIFEVIGNAIDSQAAGLFEHFL